MARKTSTLMVGLFTIMGVIMAVIAIIWVGATKYFEKGNRYVTYFDESVTGLQKDSNVKYRGVEVGRVEDIRVAPDNRLIAVIMKINLKEDLTQNTVSQLKVAGITGIVFVELDRKKIGEVDLSPKLTFLTEYPVIASQPSEIHKLLGGVNMVVEKVSQIDTRGVFDQVKSTAAEIEIFFRGKKMEAILTNVEASTANLKSLSGRVDQTVASGKLDEVLAETRDAVKEARTLLTSFKEELRVLKLPETMAKTRAVVKEAEGTLENIRRTSETMEALVGRLNDRPSDLLFGKPPKGRWNE
jgi:phospholipid/cholesterol/gamma-HCH transport system substrate-binding protein